MKPTGINAAAWLARQSFNGGTRESDPQSEVHLAEVKALRLRVRKLETENAALQKESAEVRQVLQECLDYLISVGA